MVEVDEVGRDPAARVGVGAAADDVGRVDGRGEEGRVGAGVVVVGHDDAAHAGDGGEVGGGGMAPGGAVAVTGVEAALDRPARAAQAVDALQQRQPARERHASRPATAAAAAGSGIAPSRWCASASATSRDREDIPWVAIGSERCICERFSCWSTKV
jgi:hypothetical protein